MGELHSGFDLKDAADIDLDEALASDHSWTGITCYGQVDENTVFGELLQMRSTGGWRLTDADAAGTTDGILAIATEDILSEAFGRLLLIGFIRDDSWDTLTNGGWMYVSCTLGDMTQTVPSASGDQVRKVGVASGDVTIWFNPDSTVVEVS